MPQHDLAVLVEMLAEAKRLGRALEQRGQPVLAGEERLGAQVLAVEVEKVEEVVAEAVGAVGGQVRLQRGEVGGAAGAFDHELAVEDRGLGRQRRESAAEFRSEAAGPVLAAAGQELRLAAADLRLQPVAVELDLVHPAGAVRGLRLEGGERRRDEAGERVAGLAGARPWLCRRLLRRLAGGDVLDRAAGDHRGGLFLEDVGIGLAAGGLVAALDQQPVLPLLAALRAHADEVPAALELRALQREVEPALLQPAHRVALGLPAAAVPDDHLAAAVLALRDLALEVGIVERMVLDVHRQPLVAGHQARAAGDGPARQRVADLEAEVVVQPPRRVLLHHEGVAVAAAVGPGRLVGGAEVALGPVGLERHVSRPCAGRPRASPAPSPWPWRRRSCAAPPSGRSAWRPPAASAWGWPCLRPWP